MCIDRNGIIKNIFIYIFYIFQRQKYIFILGKHANNILFYIFSICYPFHFKYIFKGKKHKTKKKIQKKQQIFKIKLRNDRFRMFGSHSKLISVVPARFKDDFGCFGLFRPLADMIRFGRYDSILVELAWFGTNWQESKLS